MTQEEIITRLIDLLDLHLQGGFESVNQDPYKNDIFKLFREAYRKRYFESFSRPRLTGDALRDTCRSAGIPPTKLKEKTSRKPS
jgi:hypothetical protein